MFWCSVIVAFFFVPTLSLVPPRKAAVANRSMSQQQPYWRSFRWYTTSLSSSMNREPSDPPPPRQESKRRMGELTPSEQVVHDTLCECAQSQYSFRIVVVGHAGAILETTVPRLGPQIKILQSPSTGTKYYLRLLFYCCVCLCTIFGLSRVNALFPITECMSLFT